MLSKKLKELRQLKGWTQKEAAAKCCVTRPAWGSYEEARAKPPIEVMVRIRQVFGLDTVEALLE